MNNTSKPKIINHMVRVLLLVGLIISCVSAFAPNAAAMQASLNIPQDWGSGESATRTTASPAPPPTPAETTMLIPNGRVIVGPGTVDPRIYLQRRSTSGSHYTVKSPVAGIVEYLFNARSFFAVGFPLLRIYDSSLLPDINTAEAAAKRYLDRPVTILGAHTDISNFPEPTPAQVARITAPTPKPIASPKPKPVSAASIARVQSAPKRAAAGPEPKIINIPDDPAPAKLSVDTDALAQRIAAQKIDVQDLVNEAARIDANIADLKTRLAKAAAEVDARQGLFENGILARVKVDEASAQKASIEADLAQLRSERSLIERSTEFSRKKIHKLEDELHSALTAPVAKPKTAQTLSQPTVARTTRQAELPSGLPVPVAQKTHAPNAVARPADLHEQPDTKRALEMVASINRLTNNENTRRISMPAIPQALTSLAQPRWDSVTAPTAGMVVDQLVPEGETVKMGTPLLRIANTQWARIFADLDPERFGEYRQGSPVVILFDDYAGTRFEGWINSITPSPDGMSLRAEIYTICTEGYFGADAYATLQWLAQAAPIDVDHDDTQLQPVTCQRPSAYTGEPNIYAMMPVVPVELGPSSETVQEQVKGQFVGSLHVAQLTPGTPGQTSSGQSKERLKKLANWRKSFTEGMNTSLFGQQVVLTYPASGPSKNAIEKMATGRVTHQPNRCARTMREALGWGLGDAADWAARLPSRGYKVREDGLCRPGDILVWPFTYGSRNTQHIGFSVMQGGRMMLLSNLSGNLGTVEIMPGYLAFYKPESESSQQAANPR